MVIDGVNDARQLELVAVNISIEPTHKHIVTYNNCYLIVILDILYSLSTCLFWYLTSVNISLSGIHPYHYVE